MKIIIDTEKKSVEVPKEFKESYESQIKWAKKIGRDTESILLDMLDIKDYRVFTTAKRQVKDKTSAKAIDDYMKKIKESHKAEYDEYMALKEKVVGTTTKGKPITTNFLVIKKWFYTKFPEQNPFKKDKKDKKVD